MAELAPVVAVDGPAAAGKGAAARALAERLGFHYLDSGKIYRAVGAEASARGISPDDGEAVRRLAAEMSAGGFLPDSGNIYSEEAGAAASRLARIPAVRAVLLPAQRAFRRLPGLVADGRDMGSTVFPDAVLKVFLTAGEEIRAARRLKQLQENKIHATITSVLADIRRRDKQDAGRAGSPLAVLPDSVVLDSSGLSVSAVVNKLAALSAARLPKKETFYT